MVKARGAGAGGLSGGGQRGGGEGEMEDICKNINNKNLLRFRIL